MAGEDIPYYQSIIEYYRSDPDIREMISVEEFTELFTFDEAQLEILTKVMTYQGFNPRRILKLATNSGKHYNDIAPHESVSIMINHAGQSTKVTLENKQTFIKDMQIIFEAFITAGSTWQKLTSKSCFEFRTYLGWMKTKYKLNVTVHASQTALGPNTVTIPRLIKCLPIVVGMIYHKGKGKRMFDKHILGFANPDAVTDAIMTPYTCSLIPRALSIAGNAPHLLFFLVHVAIDDVIHKRNKTFTDLDVILTYYLAAYRSEAVPDQSRFKFCHATNMVVNNSFAQTFLTANAKAEETIRAMRLNDPNLAGVIAKVKNIRD